MIVDSGTFSGSFVSREYVYNSPKRESRDKLHVLHDEDSRWKRVQEQISKQTFTMSCLSGHHGFAIQNPVIYPRWGVR